MRLSPALLYILLLHTSKRLTVQTILSTGQDCDCGLRQPRSLIACNLLNKLVKNAEKFKYLFCGEHQALRLDMAP